jgi:hypothetical protein
MENSFHSIISDVGRFASDVGLLWWAADLFTLAVAISGLCAQVAKSAWSWIRRREIKGRSKKLRLKIRWAWIFAFCVCVSIGSFNAWRKKDAELQREVNRYFNSSVEMVAYGKDPSKDGDTIVAFGALIRVELTNSKPSIVRQWRISIPKMAIEGAKCLEMGNYGLDVYGKGGITSRFPFLDTFGKTLHDGEQFHRLIFAILPMFWIQLLFHLSEVAEEFFESRFHRKLCVLLMNFIRHGTIMVHRKSAPNLLDQKDGAFPWVHSYFSLITIASAGRLRARKLLSPDSEQDLVELGRKFLHDAVGCEANL